MEKTNWNSEQWLKKYHNTDNYRAARKEVFLSTKDICENNGYITPEGKEVVIYDPPASVYYGKEITRLPQVNDSETVKVHVLEEDCLLTARRLVAQCFKEALSEQPYCNAFSDVYFSIKADHNDKEKKNFATFQKILHI